MNELIEQLKTRAAAVKQDASAELAARADNIIAHLDAYNADDHLPTANLQFIDYERRELKKLEMMKENESAGFI